ncbi:aldehyde dehydrogenase (NADP(+)) [Formosa undariae]|uniref:Aldehyde dehydrogenase (NADP(+)) n=1 Tax=Formosa undariae TaxID=1325436 RepID=A0ABV5F5X8_9FLAO
MITGKNYIGSQLSAKGEDVYKTFNPQSNTENEHVFHVATSEEIDEAVTLATEAFEVTQTLSGVQKAAFLNAIADEILALGDVLLETYCAETGLPAGRAQGERGRTMFQLRTFADLVTEGSWVDASIDTAMPNREPLPKSDLRKMYVPLGPIAVFGASNFALAFSTAGGDTAAAFAAGCPVIVKSHPMHAGTGELVSSAIIKAAEKTGMPNGIFSNINSNGIQEGTVLVSHPKVKAVGFTGSIRGGRALYDLATKRDELIPVFAEMGSINPVVVLPKALKNKTESWAKTYAASIAMGTGQFCTNPGLLLGVKGESLDRFISILSAEFVKIDPTCMLHPNIYEAYAKNKAKALEQPELDIVADYDAEVKPNYAKHAVATVQGKTFIENPTLHQEVFGPYSIIVQCEDITELETILSKLEGQLTGTLIADDNEATDYPKVISALQNRVGRIILNGMPTGVEVCPSMVHGGPYPSSTDSRFTSVGVDSIKRWVRPVSFQDWPNELLPDALKNENPLGILRLVNSEKTKDVI